MKTCTMNCGPAKGDARTREQRMAECTDCAEYTEPAPKPIDMVLHCPKCGLQHIDAPEVPPIICDGSFARVTPPWSNPPHRSHLCAACGVVWRPADVPTNGVAAVKTVGERDDSIAATAGKRLQYLLDNAVVALTGEEGKFAYSIEVPTGVSPAQHHFLKKEIPSLLYLIDAQILGAKS